MLLQNELFLNVATKDFPDGELRGHVAALPYSGHSARHDSECPTGLPALCCPLIRDSSTYGMVSECWSLRSLSLPEP